MCRQCNEALNVAADAALKLAQAAQILDAINDHKNSAILANAAGDLFKSAEQDPAKAKASATSGEAGKPEPFQVLDNETVSIVNATLPPGLEVRQDGLIYKDGVAVGEALIVRRGSRS